MKSYVPMDSTTVKMNMAILLVVFCLLGAADCMCDVKTRLKSEEVTEVTSPKYPSYFHSGVYCFYDFSVEYHSGDVIHVTVEDVTLSCDDKSSTLKVFDAFSTRPRYLGQVCKGGQLEFISPKERIYMVFQTGKTSTQGQQAPSPTAGTSPTIQPPTFQPSRGFRLTVKAVPEFRQCYTKEAKVLLASSEPQYIRTPYFPYEVAPDVHCHWLVKAPVGHHVILDLVKTDMRGSNDCDRFGLYLYDGKTSYDDTQLAKVCTDQQKAYRSSSNHMMVVFSSGHHVMLSGGGVQMMFYSHRMQSTETTTDYSLMFTLISILLALITVTVILSIIKFYVLPAREKARARNNDPRRNEFNSSSSQATLTSLPPDPPPPYDETLSTMFNNHVNDNSNNSGHKRGLWDRFCLCLSKTSREHGFNSHHHGRAAGRVTSLSLSEVEAAAAVLEARMRHQSGDASASRAVDMLNAGVPLAEVLASGIIPREVIVEIPGSGNVYHELPSVTSLRPLAGRGAAAGENNQVLGHHVTSERSTQPWQSVDSGYLDDGDGVSEMTTDDEDRDSNNDSVADDPTSPSEVLNESRSDNNHTNNTTANNSSINDNSNNNSHVNGVTHDDNHEDCDERKIYHSLDTIRIATKSRPKLLNVTNGAGSNNDTDGISVGADCSSEGNTNSSSETNDDTLPVKEKAGTAHPSSVFHTGPDGYLTPRATASSGDTCNPQPEINGNRGGIDVAQAINDDCSGSNNKRPFTKYDVSNSDSSNNNNNNNANNRSDNSTNGINGCRSNTNNSKFLEPATTDTTNPNATIPKEGPERSVDVEVPNTTQSSTSDSTNADTALGVTPMQPSTSPAASSRTIRSRAERRPTTDADGYEIPLSEHVYDIPQFDGEESEDVPVYEQLNILIV